MFGPIKAVAIDDEPSHLLAITTGLSTIGIPCVGYWYDRNASALRPPPPDGGLPHLRIVFTDLNLNELGGVPETAALWGVIAFMLKSVVSVSSGPYVLVFWTRMGIKADDVKAMLYERASEIDFPLPTHILALPKKPILAATPAGNAPFSEQIEAFYDSLLASVDQLKAMVSAAVASEPAVNAVAAWESRAAEAAASTINNVHRTARSDEADHRLVGPAIARVLGRIATAAAGKTAAVAAPARALDAGLLDILIDQFGASVDSQPYRDCATAVIGDIVKEKIEFRDSTATYADLNTFFQVDQLVSEVDSWDRGVVIDTKKPFNRKELGFNPTDLIGSEFLFTPEILFPASEVPQLLGWQRRLREKGTIAKSAWRRRLEEARGSLEPAADQIADANRVRARKDLKDARYAANVVLVELGADCDHAQNNQRTRRFLVALELSHEHHYLAQTPEGKLRHGALELFGPWRLGGSVKYLLVSCRRFWTWQDSTPPPNATPRYRLRASVVNKLLHRYAAWQSRPGIVEFR